MSATQAASLRPLQRPSGAFAMLAVDQREAMRAMFAEFQDTTVTDRQVSDFKLAAIRALTPHASAVLVDNQFAWERTVAEGAVAMKLLVLRRPDEAAEPRIVMVREFVARCHRVGLVSIIEPIFREQRSNAAFDWNAGVHAAAAELGDLGADLYTGGVLMKRKGSESESRAGCAKLTRAVNSLCVMLYSSVAQDRFPRAVEYACKEGAAGSLSGRAVWRSVIGQADIDRVLRENAVPRLRHLCEVVDCAVGG